MKKKKYHFFVIDDDKDFIELCKTLLESAGHKVSSSTSSDNALEKIVDLQPDCVLSDLTMPHLDGLELYRRIKEHPEIKQPIYIIVTSKRYEYDMQHALQLGIKGYIVKPLNIETFVDEVLEIIEDKMVVQFWGVRGTLPVPGKNSLHFGGNTNCVTLSFVNKEFFIFDAGTGLKQLGNYLVKQNKLPMTGRIFISHPHWDHINGIPFFVPLYIKGNEFEFLGATHSGITIEKLISDQMDSVYFPITLKEFAARVKFRSISEETFNIGEIEIQTLQLNHPGRCLGFRVKYKGKVFCYMTDNELYLKDSESYNQFDVDRLINFIKGSDVVVIDATYMDNEYLNKINWGHSCVSRVVDVLAESKVKLACLYHHDPDQTDDDIKQKIAQAKSMLKARGSKTKCIAPREGDKIFI